MRQVYNRFQKSVTNLQRGYLDSCRFQLRKFFPLVSQILSTAVGVEILSIAFCSLAFANRRPILNLRGLEPCKLIYHFPGQTSRAPWGC